MKKYFSLLACLLLVVFVLTSFAACANDGEEYDELVVYNWADYIFKYEEDFAKKNEGYYYRMTGRNIKITYVTFDTNETMLTRLTQGDSNVDVVCPSEYAIQKLIESNKLLPLNYFNKTEYRKGLKMLPEVDFDAFFNGGETDANGKIVDTGNIESEIINKISAAETFGELTINATGETVSMADYLVPYMYGTLGILYNKTEFEKLGITAEKMNKANWGILFNDDGEGGILSDGLSGNILMKDSIRDSYAATIFYLYERGKLNGLTDENGRPYTDYTANELINVVDDQVLELVGDALVKQKSQLFGYEVDFGKDDLLQGNAIVDLAWSGDAMYAVEESDGELAYYVPHTMGNIWFDGWVIPTTCNPDHLSAAKIFINYLNRPKSAAANILEIGYTAAVKADLLFNDDSEGGARSVLCEGYCVYAPEYWDVVDEKGKPIAKEDCDFESWEAFAEYFFNYYDEVDGSNWRYPFKVNEEIIAGVPARTLSNLGVMQDFGSSNKKVVTMWNYARSAGSSGEALALLGWTALAVAVAVGALFLVILIKRLLAQSVKVGRVSDEQETPLAA